MPSRNDVTRPAWWTIGVLTILIPWMIAGCTGERRYPAKGSYAPPNAELSIEEVRHERNGVYLIECQLVRYGWPLWCMGGTPDSPHSIVEVWRNGRWVKNDTDWCATEVHQIELRQGRPIRFVLSAGKGPGLVRVGLSLTSEPNEQGTVVWAWSQPVELPAVDPFKPTSLPIEGPPKLNANRP